MSVFDKVVAVATKMHVRIAYKDESPFMRLLGVLLFFNPQFMTQFTTTIGATVYFPSRRWVAVSHDAAARVLAHELVHVQDSREVGQPWFSIRYLSPQVFALPALLGLIDPYALWPLFSALLCLAPWPSKWRTLYEAKAYGMTICTMRWSGHDVAAVPPWIVQSFTGWNYYRMQPEPAAVIATIEPVREAAQCNDFKTLYAVYGDLLWPLYAAFSSGPHDKAN